jgi:hypothetical protein
MRICHFIVAVALVAFPALASAGSNSLDPLAQRCSGHDEKACEKLLKEIQHCKDNSECVAVLPFLPDSTLSSVSEDPKTESSIAASARALLQKRLADREAAEAQQRALREQRRANFVRLKQGMTVAEVEAILGPLDAATSFGAIHFSSFVSSMQLPGEVHDTVLIRGSQVADNMSMVQGGSQEKSTFSWDSDEFLLVFDFQGRLSEFTYRGA